MTLTLPRLAAAAQSAGDKLEELPPDQKVVAVAVAVCMLLVVLELVRRRKLREEYSLLWLGTAVVLMVLALEPRVLTRFQLAIGAKLPTSALFFGALVFLMLVSLLMSIRLSKLTFRNKALGQQAALAQQEIDELRAELRALERRVVDRAGQDVAKDGAA